MLGLCFQPPPRHFPGGPAGGPGLRNPLIWEPRRNLVGPEMINQVNRVCPFEFASKRLRKDVRRFLFARYILYMDA